MIGKKRIGSKLLSAFLSGTILVSSLGITTFADSLATEEKYIREADISNPSVDVTSTEGFQVTESGKNVSGTSSVENTLYETNPPEALMPDTNNEDTEEKLPSNEETDNQIIEFSQLSEEIREQIVEMNSNPEEVILPDYLEAIGIDSNIFEIPVSWISQPEFDGTKEGEYIFSPVFPEDYTVSEEIELPKIQVIVQDVNLPDTIKQVASFAVLEQTVSVQTVPVGTALEALTLPEQLEAVDEEGNTVTIPVTWKGEPEFDGAVLGTYIFTPVLPETCFVAEGVEIPSIQVMVQDMQVTSFIAIDKAISEQSVPVGTALEALTLPEQLEAVNADGTVFTIPVTWESKPEYNATIAGEYIFFPIIPEAYSVAEGVEVPSVKITVLADKLLLVGENTYEVSSPEEFETVIQEITNGNETQYTIVLKEDINLTSDFAGVPGKLITVTSETDKGVILPLATDLVGDIILDRVKFSEYNIFANGHRFETTENASGTIQCLYGGGSKGNHINGDTTIILRGGKISAYLFGGGLDSNVSGNVHIVLDGENVVVSQLFGGGHAKETSDGCVGGDVTIDFREGSTSEQFGGGMNEFSFEADMRTPATVTGTVTVNFGYEGAKAHSVCPGLAMYPKCGSYHSTVGDIRVNITDGVYMAERNVMACGYNDTVLGTVQMKIFGNPDMGLAHIVGGGEGDGTPSPLDNSGPIRILNQKNEENAIYISYNVPNENNAGHGILAGSRYNDTEISGNVLVELIDGNLDFIQTYDYVTETYQSITGHPEVLVKGGRCAQIFGDQYPKEGHKAIATVTGGNVDIGVFFSLGEVNIQNNAVVDVDSEKFEQYNGNIQKPFYSVDNLNITGNSKLTTRNSDTRIKKNVTMNHGTWHAKGYTYIYEGMYTENSQIFFDTYYQIAYNHKKNATEDTLLTSDGDTFVAMKNDYRDAIHCSIDVENSIWAIMNPLQVNGHAKFKNTTLQLPVVGNQETNNYPKKWIPIEINGLASGSAQVETVEASSNGTDSSTWISKPVKPTIGDNYLVCLAPNGTDSSTGEKLPMQSTFLLKNPDAIADNLYLKRKNDADTATADSYFMWQVAKGITVTFDKNGGDTEADPKQKVVPGGSTVGTLPTAPTRKNYTFLGWNTAADGSGTEFIATTPVTSDITVYAQWKETQEQLWYYELYYQFYDPDGNQTDENGAAYNWIRQTHGQGGWAYPGDAVSISQKKFDGKQFAWDAIDGSGKETLGIHYVFDENYGEHRLNALCSEATKDNPLKIYYRATPHTVTYQYDGVVPDGAPEVPAVVHAGYSAPVTVAENPTLSGYTFSDWKVQSPSGVEIKDGKLTMPNKDVVLVGTWNKTTPPIEPIGSITVTKYVTGNKGDYHRSFPMQITLHGENGRKINGVYGDMVFTDGVSNFTLKDNESKTANGLPADLEYSVAETDTYGHSVSYDGQTGIIPLNGTAQVTITNHKSGSGGGSNTDDDNNRPSNKPDSQNSNNNDDPVNLTTETLGSHNVSRLDDQTTSLTVNKVWKLDNGRERTDSIRVELLRDGKHYDWVTLCEDNKWSYTWSDLNDKYDWSVREDEVPAGFIAEVTHDGMTWTIINDDKPQKELPVTGQNWVIPVLLGVAGVVVISYGVYKKKSRGHSDEKE